MCSSVAKGTAGWVGGGMGSGKFLQERWSAAGNWNKNVHRNE